MEFITGYVALKLALFTVLLVFVLYVFTTAMGDLIKKYEAYEFKKSAEMKQRLQDQITYVKNQRYLKSEGINYQFGLYVGQTEEIGGIDFQYLGYNARSGEYYFQIKCGRDFYQSYNDIWDGGDDIKEINFTCFDGSEMKRVVGTMEVSPAESGVSISGKDYSSSIYPYITVMVKYYDQPINAPSTLLKGILQPGQSISDKLGNYTVTVSYGFYGYGSVRDTLYLIMEVKNRNSGITLQKTLLKLYTGSVMSFSRSWFETIGKTFYAGDDVIIVYGSAKGIPTNRVDVDLRVFLTKKEYVEG